MEPSRNVKLDESFFSPLMWIVCATSSIVAAAGFVHALERLDEIGELTLVERLAERGRELDEERMPLHGHHDAVVTPAGLQVRVLVEHADDLVGRDPDHAGRVTEARDVRRAPRSCGHDARGTARLRAVLLVVEGVEGHRAVRSDDLDAVGELVDVIGAGGARLPTRWCGVIGVVGEGLRR